MTDVYAEVLRTVSGPGILDQIQRTLDAAWDERADVPDSIRADMAAAASEIGSNIVKYATSGRHITIEMTLQVSGSQVRIDFTDDGVPATLDLASVRMPDVMAESGRGLAFAQAVLSELSYRRDDRGNHWTLVSKHFG